MLEPVSMCAACVAKGGSARLFDRHRPCSLVPNHLCTLHTNVFIIIWTVFIMSPAALFASRCYSAIACAPAHCHASAVWSVSSQSQLC